MKRGRVVPISPSGCTPEVVLHRFVDKIEHIASVALIITWNDGSISTDWSTQKTGHLVYSTVMLHREAIDIANKNFVPGHPGDDEE